MIDDRARRADAHQRLPRPVDFFNQKRWFNCRLMGLGETLAPARTANGLGQCSGPGPLFDD